MINPDSIKILKIYLAFISIQIPTYNPNMAHAHSLAMSAHSRTEDLRAHNQQESLPKTTQTDLNNLHVASILCLSYLLDPTIYLFITSYPLLFDGPQTMVCGT